MNTAPARKWRAPAIIAALTAALVVSAYLFWWKPLALTGLQIALDRQLGASNIRADFEKVELSGLNTLVIHNLSFGDLDDPASLLIRQLRLTFSLKDLIRGRFKAPAALRYAMLDRAQLALTLNRAPGGTKMDEGSPAGFMPAPIPGVPIRIRDGRLLIRDGIPPKRMLTISNIDGHILMEEEETSLIASFRTPESRGQSTALRATYKPGLLDISFSVKELNIAPLAPWIAMLDFPCRPENGRLTGRIGLIFTSPPESARLSLQSISGAIDADDGSLSITGLPFRLEAISGRFRASGRDFMISGCSLRARGTELLVEGGIHGFTSPRISISAQAPSLEMSNWYSKFRGTAACRLLLEGGPEPLTLRVSGETQEASLYGIPCEFVSAAFKLSGGFSILDIHESKAVFGNNELAIAGRLDLKGRGSTLNWTLSPAGFPVEFTGIISAKGERTAISAASGDGLWEIDGQFVEQDGILKVDLGARTGTQGAIDLKADLRAAPPYDIKGTFSFQDVPYRSCYLPLPPKMPADFGILLSAAGKLGGKAASLNIDADWTASLPKTDGYGAELRANVLVSRTPDSLNCAVSRANFRAENIIIDGEGSLSRTKEEISGNGNLMVSHLKIGRTNAESRTSVTYGSKGGRRTIELALTGLRLDDQAYPDFSAFAQEDANGSFSVKLIWEELLSAVINLREGRTDSIGVTAAFSDLPLGPMAGFASLSAPAQKASGSFTIKGPLRHAGIRGSLNWPHGDCAAKGWISLDGSGDFSLAFTALERNMSTWLPLLKSVPELSGLPEIESAVETRGLELGRGGGVLSARGWLGVRDLKIGDLILGSGNLRIEKTAERTEVEASLKGDSGAYVLYPSELSFDDHRKSLRMEFSFKDAPVGRGLMTCDQGGLRVKWDRASGEGIFFLSGLAIDETRAGEISVRLTRDGNTWRLTPLESSVTRITGGLSYSQSSIRIEADSRTEGAWLVFEGPGETGAKLSGTWKFPASPEDILLSSRGLPAPAVLPILGIPPMDGRADTDLEWRVRRDPPLSGRIRLTRGRWGEFPFEIFEITGTGTPGRAFDFSSMILRQGEDLKATGSGTLRIHPERSIDLTLTVDRLLLGYLKPFGFVEESSVVARGLLRVSGDPRDPMVNGTLRCDVGSFSPPLGFARLYLKEGRIMFQGHRAIIDAGLTDLAGAAVVVSGGSEFKGLVPTDFNLAMTAPSPVRIDGLPELFDGSARGKLNFEGTIKEPILRGKVTLEDGRLRTPPRRKQGDPEALVERLRWDLKIRFGRNVKYTMDPLGGTSLNLATLSPSPLSLIEVVGMGDEARICGEVHADSGPLTLFLGKRIWKKRPDN